MQQEIRFDFYVRWEDQPRQYIGSRSMLLDMEPAAPGPEQIEYDTQLLEAHERRIRQQISYEMACAELEDVRDLLRQRPRLALPHDQPIRALEHRPGIPYDGR